MFVAFGPGLAIHAQAPVVASALLTFPIPLFFVYLERRQGEDAGPWIDVLGVLSVWFVPTQAVVSSVPDHLSTGLGTLLFGALLVGLGFHPFTIVGARLDLSYHR